MAYGQRSGLGVGACEQKIKERTYTTKQKKGLRIASILFL